jgi:tripartite ATP-independent transporter DctM subunit
MIAFIAENMAPIMFMALVVFLLLGYPVAFSLGAVGLVFFVIGVELAPLSKGSINLSWPLLRSLPERIYGVMNNDTLLAIPFFTFMGLMLERSGMAEDLLDTIGQLFGTIRGGLAYAVIFVGALLAATTGVVAASVISMGLISLPIMLRYGYDRRVASGVIAASGTLAQIIPPSLVLIVMADQLGRSVGDMYEGAFIPGVVLAALYAGYIFLVTTLYKDAGPGLPPEAIGFREESGARGVWQLGLLVLFSGFIAYIVMSQTSVKGGADFVILTMSVGVVVSFICAVFNRLFGVRYFYVSLILAGMLIAAWMQLKTGTHTTWALFAEALAAGAAYAAVCGLVERFTGVRLFSRLAQEVTFVMVPPLALIFLVLGTIFIGVATPTEGGAMGAVGALALAAAKRLTDGNPKRFNFAIVKSATEATAKLSAFVLFILIGARIFSLTFYGVNGHIWVEHLLTSLPGGQTGFLVFVNILVFLLAFFLDFFELAFIIIPLLGPAAEKLGIDLIWFGVMLGVNMQTSFMHPPFGFALFYLRSVAPKEAFVDKVTGKLTDPVTTGQIYWGAVPFVIIQCIMVALVIIFPGMVMHYKGAASTVDPSKIDIQIPTFGSQSGGPGGLNLPSFGAPPSLGGSPSFGGPPAGLTPPPSMPSAPPGLAPGLPSDLQPPAAPSTEQPKGN